MANHSVSIKHHNGANHSKENVSLTVRDVFNRTNRSEIIKTSTDVYLSRKLREKLWLDEAETNKQFEDLVDLIIKTIPEKTDGEVDMVNIDDSEAFPKLGFWTNKKVYELSSVPLEKVAGAGCTYQYILCEINKFANEYPIELININVCAGILLSLVK